VDEVEIEVEVETVVEVEDEVDVVVVETACMKVATPATQTLEVMVPVAVCAAVADVSNASTLILRPVVSTPSFRAV
jgi:hypothetical protein